MLQLCGDLAVGVIVQHHSTCDRADSWLPTHLGGHLRQRRGVAPVIDRTLIVEPEEGLYGH
jgi:hypothetical protein